VKVTLNEIACLNNDSSFLYFEQFIGIKTPATMDSDHDTTSYILVDIGANLSNKKFSRDVDSVIQRAKEVGVQKIIVIGTSVATSKEALRLTHLFPSILHFTAGEFMTSCKHLSFTALILNG